MPSMHDLATARLSEAQPAFSSIPEMFAAQASRTPNATALIEGTGRISFGQLRDRSSRITAQLGGLELQPDDVVAVWLERGADAIAAMLATLEVGAAYLAIDPGLPPARVELMLRDAQPRVLIAPHEASAMPWRPTPLPVVHPNALTQACLPATPARQVQPEHIAYVMYTSGSTGQPKGVMNTHLGLMNRLDWMWRTFPFAADEIAILKTSASFVDSVWETWGPLLAGIPSVVASRQEAQDPAALLRLVEAHSVTRLVVVPSLLQAICDSAERRPTMLRSLRTVWVGGEVLRGELAARFLAICPCELINIYGSSEVSADATAHRCAPDDGANIPIGRPIQGCEVYVLDDALEAVPVGQPGELYVAGPLLARGYLGNPALTAARFLPNPFSATPGGRMYRMGDRVRWTVDGELEFLGRTDAQVKVRGVRVELGEVEACLRKVSDVQQAVTVATKQEGTVELFAFVTLVVGGRQGERDLLDYLRLHLPAQAVPRRVMVIDRLPLTASGKIDRIALSRLIPDRTASLSVESAMPLNDEPAYNGNGTSDAQTLRLVAEVLEVERVAATDNFFEMGGHSLSAFRVINQLNERLGLDLPVSLLLAAESLEELLEEIRTALPHPPAAN